MNIRQSGIIAALLIFFAISISGCTTTYLELKSWEGRKISDLYFEWGKADEVQGSYNRVHTWYFENKNKGKTCTKSFYTKYDGHAEIIVDTKYKDCLFLTIK